MQSAKGKISVQLHPAVASIVENQVYYAEIYEINKNFHKDNYKMRLLEIFEIFLKKLNFSNMAVVLDQLLLKNLN